MKSSPVRSGHDPQPLTAVRSPSALAHHLLDGAQQIFSLKRLDDIAICPLLLPPKLIALGALGCAENNRNVLAAVIILKVAASLKAITARHDHVQHDQIRFFDG